MVFGYMKNERSSESPFNYEPGSFGGSYRHCRWCGKETRIGQIIFFPSLGRNYCSHTCRMAGEFYILVTGAILFPLFTTFALSMYLIGHPMFPLDGVIFLAIIFGVIPSLCCSMQAYLGWKERKRMVVKE